MTFRSYEERVVLIDTLSMGINPVLAHLIGTTRSNNNANVQQINEFAKTKGHLFAVIRMALAFSLIAEISTTSTSFTFLYTALPKSLISHRQVPKSITMQHKPEIVGEICI